MYIAITKQQTGNTYQSSVKDYVAYLEKEDAGKSGKSDLGDRNREKMKREV